MAHVAETETGFESPPATGDNWQFFTGRMIPVRVPPRYQLGLFVVAIGMILLPLIYLGIFSSILWGLHWYATHTVDVFFPVVGGTRRIFFAFLILYLVPLAAGGLFALFMLKPLFVSWRHMDASAAISHVDHPLMFRFVGQLCQQMGAPIPSRIDVDVSINGSAGFRAGYRSMFGNDIVLRVGLPLVASMTCRELSCVVAHELGHFTQRTGMRMSYIIHSVNQWLVRTVYERDSFDAMIEEMDQDSSVGTLVSALVQMAVGITRGIMWVLLVIGHALSSYMSRQMEFHADACAVAVAGSEGFVTFMRKLCVLSQCSERSAVEFRNRVAPKYPDDLSAYLAMLSAQCAGETQGQILRHVAKDKTRWSSSHPAPSERMTLAVQANDPGIIRDDRPATVLFNDFSQLSRDLTAVHYLLMNRGRPFPEDRIFHVAPPVESSEDTTAEEAIVRGYFCGLGSFLRPILIDGGARMTVSLATNKEAQIIETRRAMQGTDLTGLCQSVADLDAKMLRMIQWEAMGQAGIAVTSEASGLSSAEAADPVAARQGIEYQLNQIAAALEPFEQMAKLRLTTSLGLLRTKNVGSAIPNASQLHDEVTDLLHMMGRMRIAFPALLEMRREYAVLQGLLACRGDESAVSLEDGIKGSAHRVAEHIARIHEALGSTQYPFDPAERHRTIVDYARAKQYDPEPSRMAGKEAECHLQSLVALYYRLLARLAQIALEVEARLEGAPASSA